MSDLSSTTEIERLRREVDELTRTARPSKFERWLPLISTLVPVLALVFTVQQFGQEQEAGRAQLARQAATDSIARERAFMQPVLERQMTTYFDAATAAATIASARSAAERQTAMDTFWKLYYGPLVMLESKPVSAAMVAFSQCLSATSTVCADADLKNRSLALASAFQTDYFSSWKLSPAKYAERMTDYAKAGAR